MASSPEFDHHLASFFSQDPDPKKKSLSIVHLEIHRGIYLLQEKDFKTSSRGLSLSGSRRD